MAIVVGFQIPVGRPRSDKFPILHKLSLRGFDLPAYVQCVSLVYHVPQRDQDAKTGVVRVGGIVILVDGNKADAALREVGFDVVAGVDGVSAQPGEVLHDYAVYKSSLNVGEHLLEAGAVEVRTRSPVVNVGVVSRDLRVAVQKLRDDELLRFDGCRPRLLVLHRKPDVDCRPANGLCLLHWRRRDILSAFSCHD